LTEALALFRGPPLADFTYESWARGEIERLEELRLVCLEDRIEADIQLGRHAELVGELEVLIAEHPLRERLRGQLMVALYRAGRQAEALDAYKATRDALIEGLGIEPGEQLRSVHGQILNQDPSLAAPERIVRPETGKGRLPAPTSSFIGRQREVAELCALVRGGARLVTLTGPGGSGKTRLAVEAASAISGEFKSGVVWVGLASLRDPVLVLETVAQTLGARDGLATHIGERRLLLLLDNMEQVVEAAPDLAELVETCAKLVVLVTSRELLRIRGEVEYMVLPLADSDAVELFCSRAQLPPDLSVAELCQRLDNMPLALELAAARTGALAPAQIVERLGQRLDLLKGGRDADPRQHTLRATIAWSHDLLAAEEQRLFADLGVWVSGCTLEAAEQAAGADLDTLESLVHKSLLRVRDGRYWMLETIREFALERLADSGREDDVRRRHAEWLLDVAERAAADWGTPRQAERLAGLGADHDNLMSALDWASVADQAIRLRLTAALGAYWYWSGCLREGPLWLEPALELLPRVSVARWHCLHSYAHLLAMLGRQAAMAAACDEGISLAEELGDPRLLARALDVAAQSAAERSDFELAQDRYERSGAIIRELGDDWLLTFNARGLAYLAGMRDDHRGSIEAFEAVATTARANGDFENLALALSNIGIGHLYLDEREPAISPLVESLPLFEAIGWLEGGVYSLIGLAAALLSVEPSRAARFLGAAEALRDRIGLRMQPQENDLYEETLRELVDLSSNDVNAELAAGRQLSLHEAVAEAVAEEGSSNRSALSRLRPPAETEPFVIP
jgi:predicted ATPase